MRFFSLSFCLLFLNHIRSVPLKSQLNTYTEKGKIPVLDFLSAALESVEYERALARGLVSSNTSFFSDVFLLSHSGKFSMFFFLRKNGAKFCCAITFWSCKINFTSASLFYLLPPFLSLFFSLENKRMSCDSML